MSTVLIRADGGPSIGLGHITRCRALAQAFYAAGLKPVWLTATAEVIPSGLEQIADLHVTTRQDEFDAITAMGPGILIGDWKDTDPGLIARLRLTGLIVVLIGNQTGDVAADLIVKQRFDACTDSHRVHRLDGAPYLLLSSPFRDLARTPSDRPARRLLVSLGGSRSALIDRIIALCESLAAEAGLTLDLLRPDSGGQPHPAADVAQRMMAADFAVLAGGTSLHEAAACRLPALCLPIVPRQLDRARSWEALGFGASLVPDTPHWIEQFRAEFLSFCSDPARRNACSKRQQSSVDGRGASRIVEALRERWPEHTRPTESV